MRRVEPGGERPGAWAVAAWLAVAVALLYLLRLVVLPIVVAAALAFVLGPLVAALQRRLGVPRLAAVLVVYAAILAGLGAIGWALFDAVDGRAAAMVAEAPHLLADEIRRLFGPEIHAFGRTIGAEDLSAEITATLRRAVSLPDAAVAAGGILIGVPAIGVLMLVVLFYCLAGGDRLAAGALLLAPPRHRAHLHDLAQRLEPMLRDYVRGMIVIMIYTSGSAWLVLGALFHVPFALPTALLVGLLEFIPVVGPAAAMAIFGAAALLDGGGLWTVVGLMVLAAALRVSIDLVVAPLVLGHAVTLHPLVIILAFLIGASLFGILGVFIAVPAAAATRIVLAVWYGEEDAPP